MAEYIDKGAALGYIIFGVVGRNITCGELRGAIEHLPTVEIVRCKDCIHSQIEGDTTVFMWCGYWNKPTDGIRYCSDGERSE